MRVMGLEPIRQYWHMPLKHACLPIPAHSHNICGLMAQSAEDYYLFIIILFRHNFNFNLLKMLENISLIHYRDYKNLVPAGLISDCPPSRIC